MAELAKSIEVVQVNGPEHDREYHLRINGEEFPWYVSKAGVATTLVDDEMPAITITILAEAVHTQNVWPGWVGASPSPQHDA